MGIDHGHGHGSSAWAWIMGMDHGHGVGWTFTNACSSRAALSDQCTDIVGSWQHRLRRRGHKIRNTAQCISAFATGLAIETGPGVRGFDPAAKDMDPSEPFQFHGGRVTPTLDGTVYAVNGATLSSYESQTCTFAFVGP